MRTIRRNHCLETHSFSLPKGERSHDKVWNHFINCQVTEVASAGSQLGSLAATRREANYEMLNLRPESYETAEYAICKAKDNTQLIQTYFVGPRTAELIANITFWRKNVMRMS